MTGEQRHNEPDDALPAGRRSVLRSTQELDAATGSGLSPASPLRWMMVIALLLLNLLALTNLAGVWTLPFQSAREAPGAARQHPAAEKRAARPGPAVPTAPGKAVPRKSGFDVAVVLGRLARADPEEGARVFKMCAACHTDDKGGPHGLGSNLWNVVGSPKAARPEFRYSQALRAKGGIWSYRELAEYLHDPRASVPGTSMAFVGIKDNDRMASLIAYMRTRADRPVPLPH
jgi:cytochrome c